MFWNLAACFSIRSDSSERNLHLPKQHRLAVAHTQAKHLRPAGQTLTAKFLRPLRKNQTNTDSTFGVRGILSLRLIAQATAASAEPRPLRRTR